MPGVLLKELSYQGSFLTLPPPYLRQWTSLESLDLSRNTLILDQVGERSRGDHDAKMDERDGLPGQWTALSRVPHETHSR
jgi:hypothetical protein